MINAWDKKSISPEAAPVHLVATSFSAFDVIRKCTEGKDHKQSLEECDLGCSRAESVQWCNRR